MAMQMQMQHRLGFLGLVTRIHAYHHVVVRQVIDELGYSQADQDECHEIFR